MADQPGASREGVQRGDITAEEKAHILQEKIHRVGELTARILSRIEGGASYADVKDMYELVSKLRAGLPTEALVGINIAGMESAVVAARRKG